MTTVCRSWHHAAECARARHVTYTSKRTFRDRLGTRGESENELLSAESKFRPEVSRLSCQIPYDKDLDGMTLILPGD